MGQWLLDHALKKIILFPLKFLGFFFSFKTDILMQNWDALVRSVPRSTTLSLLNPNAGLPDSSDQKKPNNFTTCKITILIKKNNYTLHKKLQII